MTVSPACHGSAVVVSNHCETCQKCKVRDSCVSQAISFVESLTDTPAYRTERERLALVQQALTRDPFDVHGGGTTISKKRIALSAEQEKSVASIGKSAGSIARGLFERSWFEFARSEMRQGRNPGRNEWQKIFCDALINGGTTRNDLQVAYQEQLDLKPDSARVRVSKAISVFHVGRLVVERSGMLLLNPN